MELINILCLFNFTASSMSTYRRHSGHHSSLSVSFMPKLRKHFEALVAEGLNPVVKLFSDCIWFNYQYVQWLWSGYYQTYKCFQVILAKADIQDQSVRQDPIACSQRGVILKRREDVYYHITAPQFPWYLLVMND